MRRFAPWLLLMLCLVLASCAGNGNGLDENGNPIGSDGGEPPLAFEPTYTNIQQNVFSTVCTQCHIGPAAPQGLQLDAANAYNMLVGIPSTERPDVFRVESGNPDASYIVRKIQGGPDIAGAQMPLNQAALSQETINSIRAWIAKGAPRD